MFRPVSVLNRVSTQALIFRTQYRSIALKVRPALSISAQDAPTTVKFLFVLRSSQKCCWATVEARGSNPGPRPPRSGLCCCLWSRRQTRIAGPRAESRPLGCTSFNEAGLPLPACLWRCRAPAYPGKVRYLACQTCRNCSSPDCLCGIRFCRGRRSPLPYPSLGYSSGQFQITAHRIGHPWDPWLEPLHLARRTLVLAVRLTVVILRCSMFWLSTRTSLAKHWLFA